MSWGVTAPVSYEVIMQYTKSKIYAQQLVMFHLGFYTGIIDGIWGPTTIDAKKAFESDPKFLPAYPNGGMPFGDRDRLPAQCSYNPDGTITHSGLDAARTAEIKKAMEARTEHKRGESPTSVHVDEQPFIENADLAADTQQEKSDVSGSRTEAPQAPVGVLDVAETEPFVDNTEHKTGDNHENRTAAAANRRERHNKR